MYSKEKFDNISPMKIDITKRRMKEEEVQKEKERILKETKPKFTPELTTADWNARNNAGAQKTSSQLGNLDRCTYLYNQRKNARKDRHVEEIEYEKSKSELTLKPVINKE
jgi:hypothetical protein